MAIIIPIIAKFIDEGLEDAKRSIEGTEGAIGKTTKALEALNAPAKAVFAGMVTGLVGIAKNAGGAKKSQDMLAASFKAVGYPENAAAASAYADTLQHVIGVSDEEIQATMQKLAAFDQVAKSQDLMADATQAAADIAAAGFGTMDSAAKALGKALQDPEKNLGALTRMGITFDKQQREQIKTMMESGKQAQAQAIIMEEVGDTFGGVAEVSASGTEKMKLAWDEVAETLGASLAPILGKVNELLIKLAGWVSENAALVTGFAKAILGVSGAIIAINATIKIMTAVTAAAKAVWVALRVAWILANATVMVLTGQIKLNQLAVTLQGVAATKSGLAQKAYAVAAKIAAAATKIFNAALKAMKGPLVWIGLAIAALAVLVIKNWDQIKAWTLKVWNWIGDFLTDLWNDIKRVASNVFDQIKNVIDRVWDAIKAIFKVTPFGMVVTHLDDLKRWIGNAFDWVKNKIDTVWDWIKGLFKANPFAPIQGFLQSMESWFSNTFANIKGKIDELVAKVKGAVDTIKSAWNTAKDLAASMPKPGKGKGAPSTAAVARVLAAPVTAALAGGVPVPQAQAVAVRGAGGGGVTINVNGALDPESVARQIRKLLDKSDLRNSRTVLRPVAW